MARLGGSPLGIIGLMSVPQNGGISGFNGGKANNFNVTDYNTGAKTQVSIFSGNRRLRPWPNIAKMNTVDKEENGNEKVRDTTGLSDVYQEFNSDGTPKKQPDGLYYVDRFQSSRASSAKGSNKLHNNDVYDTSVLNILERLSGTKAQLKPQDFAYLKDLGVYPNNRLMIARRFYGPSGDNIMTKTRPGAAPMATLISWVPEGDNFLDITFGEVWTEAKADFTGMLNSLGEDFKVKAMGDRLGQLGGSIPLPGFTEIFQRKFMAKLGLLEESAANSIPAGNPNLIKEAKVRKTVGYSEPGSGLMAKVSITMNCEYELKFISGIDPTIVWMDLIGMILRFGTSDSSNYGLSGKVASKINKWARDPYSLITDVVNGIKNAIAGAYTELKNVITGIYNSATKAAQKLSDGSSSGSSGEKKSERELAMDAAKEAQEMGMKVINGLFSLAAEAIRASVMKYRVEVLGIVNALTGNPSTPWHITIGNPMRPVFCSGDMLTTEVQLVLGPTLAFNDLPSSISVKFTLANARNLGLQEIMSKFNSGYLRTVDTQRSFFETNVILGNVNKKEKVGELPFGELTLLDKVGEDPPKNVNQGGGNNPTNEGANNSSGTSGTGSSGTSGTGSSGTSGTGSSGTSGTGSSGTSGTGSSGTSGTSGIKKSETSNSKVTDDAKVPGGTKDGSKDEKTTQSKTQGGGIPS